MSTPTGCRANRHNLPRRAVAAGRDTVAVSRANLAATAVPRRDGLRVDMTGQAGPRGSAAQLATC